MIGQTLAIAATGAAALIGRGIFVPHSSLFGKNLSRVQTNQPHIALTFDDGPHPEATPQILSILAAHHVSATFFVIGKHVADHPQLVARIHNEGHLIANHTYSHNRLGATRSISWNEREMLLTNDEIEQAIGLRPQFYRPPVGIKSPRICIALRRQRMKMVTWSLRGRDGVRTTAAQVQRRIISRAKAGDIILLHDGVEPGRSRDVMPTIESLPRIIESLRKQGLEFVRLDKMLDLDGYCPLPSNTR